MQWMLRVVALLLLSTTVAHAGAIYACKSIDGSATYQDTPCPKGTKGQSLGLADRPVNGALGRLTAVSAVSTTTLPRPMQARASAATAAGTAIAPLDPATFSPAEWIRAAGDAPWIPLAGISGGNAVSYSFTAHDYGALLSIKTISARIGMVFQTGRVNCHPGVDNDYLANATGSVFDPATGRRLIGDFLLDSKQTQIRPGTVFKQVVSQVCGVVRLQHGEVSHPPGNGQTIKPDETQSPLASSMIAGMVDGSFRMGHHSDVHTTVCPPPHASPLNPAGQPFASTDIAQYVVLAASGDTGALQRLREAAAGGVTLAAYKLGKLYGYGCHDGRGIALDNSEAMHWYTIAAEQGHADSQLSLSLLYANGQGVPKDPAKARYWGDKSVTQSALSTMTINGRRLSKSEAPSVFTQVSKRAALGDAVAEDELGDMYMRGFGVKSDLASADQWYSKAALQGNAQGQRHLALSYDGSNGRPRNDSLMLHWLSLAAANGDAMAADRMGKLYYGGGLVLRDTAQAAHWFAIAADEGYGPSQYILATMYSRGLGVPRDDVQAIKWFLIDLAAIDNLVMSDDLFVQSEARADAAQIAEAQKLARQWWSANANKEQAYPR